MKLLKECYDEFNTASTVQVYEVKLKKMADLFEFVPSVSEKLPKNLQIN